MKGESHVNHEKKIYLVRAGRVGQDEDRALEDNIAIIDFIEIPSLEAATDYASIHGIVTEALPDARPRAVSNVSHQLLAFAVAMKQGDLVVLPRKLTPQIAIGRVTGPYEYRQLGDSSHHVRAVEWLQTDLPRTVFEQDLLYSLGALQTVCNISRNNAEQRVAAVADGKPDPGPLVGIQENQGSDLGGHIEELPNVSQLAHDQIVAHIQATFTGHGLASLVEAVLRADGWLTKSSSLRPPRGRRYPCARLHPVGVWWARKDLNLRPPAYKAGALT